ncbi:DNA polymerase III [Longibacter salinarum]|uniref:DNA polymerase beta n=1 Tax=Longibacter salinarum TaxID=1850348 RepID=A0A2A8D1W9_9BACT|nr:DNA polymerase/3'-5' exonuclease PolX [Longibacter salinarum]PEN14962.1 DNA polymerase III [Longibacter salinarum]
MPIHNADVATVFEEVADLLDLQGANPFRIRAYRNAARTLSQLSEPVAEMIRDGRDLSELPDIGDDLAEKIEVIVQTGTLPLLEELEKEVDPAMTELMDVPGLGPSRVRTLHDELGISSRAELTKAAEEGKVRTIKGFGEKSEQNILKGLKDIGEEKRWLLSRADPVVHSLKAYLEDHEAVEKVDVAGSYRRRKETVGDLDLLVLSDDGVAVSNHFVEYEDVVDVASKGDTRSTVRLRSDIQVDLRVVPPDSYGAALLYFTGSKAHNVALRNRAVNKGMKINEYGVFRVNGEEERIGGETEEGIYGLFDLPYIVPELRENRGELEAAQGGHLPNLITLDDLRGNLHAHTTDSDGQDSIQAMAEAAKERGLEYLAITDHSPAVAVAQGLDSDELRRQMDAIDELNEMMVGVRVLKSIEVDIMKDGSLDLPDDVLDELDLCVCSVHTSLGLSEKEQTERILRAMDNPNFHILAHPTGRRLNQRGPIDVDLDRIMEAAVERGCFLELNAQPQRLDLNDVYCKRAKELGLKISIGADAHARDELDFLKYGIDQARRGWLEPGDVLNTMSWNEIKPLIDARR